MARLSTIPSTGNPIIDHQHGRLSELLLQAAQSARNTADTGPFRQALNEFSHYLGHHFSVETVIIRGAGFDAATRHDRAHAAILGRVETILASLDDLTTASQRHRVLDEFEHILIDHEMLEDAAYWDALRAHGASFTLKWSGLMVTGIDWLDRQHQAMVDLFNRLSEAAHDGKAELSAQLLAQLRTLAHDHFREEERQIDTWGVTLPEHRANHARMLTELDQVVGVNNDHRLLVDHYLRFWLMDHILGRDLKDLAGRT